MRLLRPTPGECADRQTILHLKAKYGELKHINVKPFTDEIAEIQDYLDKNWFTRIDFAVGAQFDSLWKRLSEINTDLWKVEDEVRLRAREKPLNEKRLVEIALYIPIQNDLRAKVVQEINRLFLVAEQEKVYISA